jgi:hypothetical protein
MVGKRNAKRPLTDAERQAKSRLAKGRGGHGQPTAICTSPPELLTTLIPRHTVEIDELEKSAAATMGLYNKLVRLIEKWSDKLGDDISVADGFKAFALLAPALESIATIRGKIIEQRGSEARDVTAQMQTNLEASGKREAPKIGQTLELLRRRFEDNKKPKAT